MALRDLNIVFSTEIKHDSLESQTNPTAISVASYFKPDFSPTKARTWPENQPMLDHVDPRNEDYLHLLCLLYWDLNGSAATE